MQWRIVEVYMLMESDDSKGWPKTFRGTFAPQNILLITVQASHQIYS